MTARAPVLLLEGVRYRWPRQQVGLEIPAFTMHPSERVFLRGPSGSGKSTLLNLIAGTLSPQAGSIRIGGHDVGARPASARDRLRADLMGVVFQQFNLLPFLDLLGNVTLPCRFSRRRREMAQRAYGSVEAAGRALLSALGLDEQVVRRNAVSELSVGQQQRVAVARALIGEPALVLADEPTAALDADARDQFIALLLRECTRSGAAVLFVSHDAALAKYFTRALDLGELDRPAPLAQPA